MSASKQPVPFSAVQIMPGITVAVLTNAGGAHLDVYLAGLAVAEEVDGVVVADPSGASEVAAGKVLGGKLKGFEREYAKALAGYRPGMALVTMEAVQAPPVIQLALEANCHVLAEKPSCVRAEDFVPLVRLADMKHRLLMLALANRLRGTVEQARKLILDVQIGKLYGCELHIVADQTRLKNPDYHRSWFADRARSGGGHLMWLGIHWIDLVMYMTGSKIVEAAGFTGIVGGQPLKVEDSAAMAVRFDNGSFGTITSGYYLDRGYHSHIKIWGSHGWLQLEPHGGEPLMWYSTKDTPPEVKRYNGPPDEASYTPLIKAAVRASLDLQPPPLTGADSLLALQTVFACYRAAETGRAQSVS
jgi:predicted dehydrogenase